MREVNINRLRRGGTVVGVRQLEAGWPVSWRHDSAAFVVLRAEGP